MSNGQPGLAFIAFKQVPLSAFLENSYGFHQSKLGYTNDSIAAYTILSYSYSVLGPKQL